MDMAMEPEIWQTLPEQWEPRTEFLMEAEIWQALPQDLLLKILARLPVRAFAKMRTVCRQWKELLSSPDAPQIIHTNLSVHSIPGFLVQLEWEEECIVGTWVIEYLGGDTSDMNIYKAPLADDVVIVDACKSIYCSHKRWDRWNLSIGNLATGSRRRLPNPPLSLWWSFIAMDFDASRRCCTVLLGGNNYVWRQPDVNRMVIQIYNSESIAWTMVEMIVPKSLCPKGKGIYSKGKVYWIISSVDTSRMIAFTMADRRWAEIGLPQGCGCDNLPRQFQLSGCDGCVVLMVYRYRCLCNRIWTLKEGPGAPEWCEPNPIWRPGGPKFYTAGASSSGWTMMFDEFYTAGANSSGWTMMFDEEWKISLCNPKRRLIRRITLPLLGRSANPSRVFVSAFESNNVYWP